jgi:ferredoxin
MVVWLAEDVFARLADALDGLPNGFPRTKAGYEILILKRIFSLDEARLACGMGRAHESVDVIAGRAGVKADEAAATLEGMARKELVWADPGGRFRLAPFIVGIYEAQEMDPDLAHLVEHYFHEGGAAGIMGPSPALHRVVPSWGAAKTEWILPYDDVKMMIEANKTFHLADCVCREQQEQLGRRCKFPKRTCLSFTAFERKSRPGDVSKEEALRKLDEFEELGLVHTVSNVVRGPTIGGTVSYVCNCCGCCCGILRGITEFGVEGSVAQANYYSEVDASACVGCGVCVGRCQVKAVQLVDGVAVVNRKACIGCGLCVTKCPSGAARLVPKSESEVVHPPVDFEAWERERLRNRGLAG